MAADLVATSWVQALPRVSAGELALRRRVGPLLERLNRWGPLFAEALPRALESLWGEEAAPPAGPTVRIELSGPGVALPELRIDRFPYRIGRGEACDLQLPSPAVSTEHAELRRSAEQLILLDLRSTNGTKRNGERLVPLDAVELASGDVVEIGPFSLTPRLEAPAPTSGFEIRATPLAPRERDALFAPAHPSDRWVRARWGGDAVWLRVPAGWMRSAWERAASLPPRDGEEIDPMEEGAAQYLLVQAASALARETGQPIELSAWLTPDEARRAARSEGTWLGGEVVVRGRGADLSTELAVPVPESEPPLPRSRFADLAWPAAVCLGLVRLKLSEWRDVEAGDALLPDVWWPTKWRAGPGKKGEDLGPAWVRVRRAWHGGRLLRSEAGVNLRLDSPWLDTPGGDWLMAEEDALGGAATPSSLPVDDLELQVAVELDRFPVTLGELQRWRAGEVLNLRQGPNDPVRLVVETGLQRRVLGEGRLVLVNDRLAIEIVRILTRFEDSTPRT